MLNVSGGAQVQQSRNLLRANLTLGSFKLDVATVWAQPGTSMCKTESGYFSS